MTFELRRDPLPNGSMSKSRIVIDNVSSSRTMLMLAWGASTEPGDVATADVVLTEREVDDVITALEYHKRVARGEIAPENF